MTDSRPGPAAPTPGRPAHPAAGPGGARPPVRATARILSVQSAVVAGAVGHGASLPALTLLGHEVRPLPTVILSGHAATPGVAGRRLPGEEVAALAGGLAAAGALADLDAALFGYLGSEDAALAGADLLAAARAARPGLLALVDPVLGDDGRLYLPEAVGTVQRDRLLPLADAAAPNVFELGWLTGLPVESDDEVARAAVALRDRLRPDGPRVVFVTSIGGGTDRTGILAADGAGTTRHETRRVPRRLNGAGDFVAALLLAELLEGRSAAAAAARAAAAAHALARAAEAAGRDDLPVVAARDAWLGGAAR